MTLHGNPDLFRNAILLTATARGLSQSLIEKDYWVTWVLRNLADSTLASQVVFKGGTSLSKAYRLVDRFSEDIDLAVLLAGRTPSAVKTLLRDVQQAAVAGGTAQALAEVPGTGKWGQIRRVHHRYPQLFAQTTADVTEDILLEITAFGQPHPVVRLPLVSYIGEMFAQQGLGGEVAEFGLQPFEFNILSVGRTFAEKIMALVRASYQPDPAVEVASKVRHLYDLHHLVAHPEVAALLENDELFALLRAVQADDAVAGVKGPNRDWKTLPLSTCWAYCDAAANLQQARQAYERDLPGLLHTPAPAFPLIVETMQRIAARLRAFDE